MYTLKKPIIKEQIKIDNIICNYLRKVYKNVSIPTVEKILAKSIIMKGSVTKKGLSRAFFCELDDLDIKHDGYSSIEHNINWYFDLVSKGIQEPTVSPCSRVSDSFTSMPTWIRDEVKIDNEKTIELDFTALHPNLWALKYNLLPESEQIIFDKYISGDSHTKIAKLLGIERKEVKKNFLSYFNDTTFNQSHYKIDKFFINELPTLKKIITDMKKEELNSVSDWLFHQETYLMSCCIEQFELKGINALQIYDAFIVPESKEDIAREIMNEVALSLGLETYAK